MTKGGSHGSSTQVAQAAPRGSLPRGGAGHRIERLVDVDGHGYRDRHGNGHAHRPVGRGSGHEGGGRPSPTSLARALAGALPRLSGGVVDAAPAIGLRRVARRFWPWARPYRVALAGTLAAVAAGPALEAARLWLFKLLVDDVLVPIDLGAFWWLAVAFVGLTVAAGVVSYADDVLSAWLGERFLLSLRTDVFAHLQRLGPGFFERRRSGDLVARLTQDVAAIETFVLSGPADAVSYLARILFFGTAMALIDWRLALAAVAVAPAVALLARRFSSSIRGASREKRRRSGSLSALAEEALQNTPLVQALGQQDRELARFEREGAAILSAQLAASRLKALYGPVVELIEVLAALAVIGLAVHELRQGRLTLGGLLVFLAYVGQLFDPIRGIGRLVASLHGAAAGAERVIELLDEQPEVREHPAARACARGSGAIRLDHVTYTYPGADGPALADLTLELAPGDTVALVGASGAGKSTLLRLLLRLVDPDSGAVLLDGADLRELTLASARANVAVVFQETLLPAATVAETIAFGRPQATQAEIERAAVAADAHEFVSRLPDGYTTRIGERGQRLSGGQRQRLAIARAFLLDAPVLLLDEPTAALDAETARRVMAPLARLRAGRTTLLVTHDLQLAREAERIVVLAQGRVLEQGAHEQLLAREGVYARLWHERAAA